MNNIPENDLFSLAGKTALVCGASRGIGAATAQMLASRGARIVLLARDESKLAAVASALPLALTSVEGAQRPHIFLPCDLSDRVDLRAKITALLARTGPIHVLVNNSGGPKAAPVLAAEDDDFVQALSQHVLAAQTLVKLLAPGMKESGYGRIVNIISTSVRVPIAGLGVSNTVRAAMAGWAKTLAGEVGPHGITVNNVLPGYTLTERLDALLSSAAQRTGKSTADIELEWKKQVPLGRFACADEIAAAVCYFASPAGAYTTGQSLAVDGGRIGAI